MFPSIKLNNQNTANEEGSYQVGMDLFMLLNFCFMVMLMSSASIPISGMSPKNGVGKPGEQLLIVLNQKANKAHIMNVDNSAFLMKDIDISIKKHIDKTNIKHLVLVSKKGTKVENIYLWVDELTGIVKNNNLAISIGLSVAN